MGGVTCRVLTLNHPATGSRRQRRGEEKLRRLDRRLSSGRSAGSHPLKNAGRIRASPTGYWAGAERDLGCKNLGPQSVSSCRPKSLHDCDRRPVTILGSGPLTDSAARHSGVSNRVLGGCRAGLGVQKPRAAKRLVLPVAVTSTQIASTRLNQYQKCSCGYRYLKFRFMCGNATKGKSPQCVDVCS